MTPTLMRGLRLLGAHFRDGGHQWDQGGEMAAAREALAWLDAGDRPITERDLKRADAPAPARPYVSLRIRGAEDHVLFVARTMTSPFAHPPELAQAIEGYQRALAEHGTPAAILGTPPPAAAALVVTCTRCNDTHRMWLTAGERYVSCTGCPLPCADCAGGIYCSLTPCTCACHARKAAAHGAR